MILPINASSVAAVTTILSSIIAPTTTRSASSASYPTATNSPPSGSYISTHAASVSQCSGRMDGKLPSFVPTGFEWSGKSRQYYLQAEDHIWDYEPSKYDNMRGIPIESTPQSIGNDYAKNENSLGSTYLKSLFKGYTSDKYDTYTAQPDWIGFQGPIIRGEVGDMIEVMLYNNLSHVTNMHNMGLQYNSNSEGSNYYRGSYDNGTAITFPGSAIQPQSCYVYKWLVTTHSAPDPGPYAPPSKLWSYHGDLNLQNDVFNGLMGPCLVYKSGEMDKVMKENKEFILFIATTNEAESYYVNDNVAEYAPEQTFTSTPSAPMPAITSPANSTIWQPIFDDLPASGSNTSLAQQFMVMNGYGFQNLPILNMCQDEPVVWHFWSMGGFNDGFHSIHLHGHNVRLSSGAYTAQVSLSPASMVSSTMGAINPGVWQLLCHVGDHWQMGMEILYNVTAHGVNGC